MKIEYERNKTNPQHLPEFDACPMHSARQSRVQSQLFGNFTAPARYVIQSQHSGPNVQVSIFVTCLNFAGTGSRILLRPVSSSRRVIPSRKFTLNFNGEISYRELARRPWSEQVIHCQT